MNLALKIIYDLNTIIPIIEDLDTQDLDLDQTGLFTEPNYIMDSVSSVIDEINNKIEMLSSSNTSGLETDDLKHFYEACRRFALFLTKIDRYDEALLIIDKIDFSDLGACALIDIIRYKLSQNGSLNSNETETIRNIFTETLKDMKQLDPDTLAEDYLPATRKMIEFLSSAHTPRSPNLLEN